MYGNMQIDLSYYIEEFYGIDASKLQIVANKKMDEIGCTPIQRHFVMRYIGLSKSFTYKYWEIDKSTMIESLYTGIFYYIIAEKLLEFFAQENGEDGYISKELLILKDNIKNRISRIELYKEEELEEIKNMKSKSMSFDEAIFLLLTDMQRREHKKTCTSLRIPEFIRKINYIQNANSDNIQIYSMYYTFASTDYYNNKIINIIEAVAKFEYLKSIESSSKYNQNNLQNCYIIKDDLRSYIIKKEKGPCLKELGDIVGIGFDFCEINQSNFYCSVNVYSYNFIPSLRNIEKKGIKGFSNITISLRNDVLYYREHGRKYESEILSEEEFLNTEGFWHRIPPYYSLDISDGQPLNIQINQEEEQQPTI